MIRYVFGIWVVVLSLAVLFAGACGDDDDDADTTADDDDDAILDDDDDAVSFALTSTAFDDQGTIPVKYTCDNDNPDRGFSPPLAWTNVPAGTAAFALTVRDPDAPNGDTKHWGLIDIPADATSLDEGVSPLGPLPTGAWETLSYTGETGYAGPCPPEGDEPHRYNFTLIAMSAAIGNPGEEVELDDVLDQIDSLTIESVTLTGLYGR